MPPESKQFSEKSATPDSQFLGIPGVFFTYKNTLKTTKLEIK